MVGVGGEDEPASAEAPAVPETEGTAAPETEGIGKGAGGEADEETGDAVVPGVAGEEGVVDSGGTESASAPEHEPAGVEGAQP